MFHMSQIKVAVMLQHDNVQRPFESLIVEVTVASSHDTFGSANATKHLKATDEAQYNSRKFCSTSFQSKIQFHL